MMAQSQHNMHFMKSKESNSIVKVVPYRKEWLSSYYEEANQIRNMLKDVLIDIHHIGSTSVPNLAAKPIIDILLEVHNLEELNHMKQSFEKLDYECMGEFGIPGRRYYRKDINHKAFHIHAFETEDHKNIDRHIAVSEFLKMHDEDAYAYAKIKIEMAQQFPDNIK